MEVSSFHQYQRVSCPLLRAALLAALLPLFVVQMPQTLASSGKPTVSESAQRAALRSELSSLLLAKGVPKAGIARIVANLDAMDMAALRDLAGFAGNAATGAERLLPGSAGAVRDRAGELTGRAGIGTTGSSASQQGIERALRPGVNDTRGQTSSCDACKGQPTETEKNAKKTTTPDNLFLTGGVSGGTMINPEQPSRATRPSKNGDGSTAFSTADGTWITIYGDGSVRIATDGNQVRTDGLRPFTVVSP